MAEKGNPFASDSLAASLVTGDAQQAWLTAKRSEGEGSTRPISIPELNPEMSTQLKLQAAKALIDIGDTRGGLTRSDHMALAIAMGQAFRNKVGGDNSQANESLLHTTASHFVRTMLGGDKQAEAEQSRQNAKAMSANRRNAVDGLQDALRARVPGADSVARMLRQVAGGDASTQDVLSMSRVQGASEAAYNAKSRSVEGDATGADRAAKERVRGSSVMQTIWDKLNGLFRTGDNKRKNKRDGADSNLDATNKSEVFKACDVVNGRQARGKVIGLNAGFSEEQENAPKRSGMRSSFKVGERSSLVKLDSGRVWDPVLNRCFKRVGNEMVEDDKPQTENEKSQIADLIAEQQQQDQPAAFLGHMQAHPDRSKAAKAPVKSKSMTMVQKALASRR
jgi:hypothetical protein